jgi:hypothetical protein
MQHFLPAKFGANFVGLGGGSVGVVRLRIKEDLHELLLTHSAYLFKYILKYPLETRMSLWAFSVFKFSSVGSSP